MKLSSERKEVLLHLAWETPLLQPRMPPPRSPGVRVALQISVWACAGAARASSAVAASRARQARVPGPCVRFPASQRRRALGRAPAPAARPSGSDAHSILRAVMTGKRRWQPAPSWPRPGLRPSCGAA